MTDVLAALKTLGLEEFRRDRTVYQKIYDHVIHRLGAWAGSDPVLMDSFDEIYQQGNTATVHFPRIGNSALPVSVKAILAIHTTSVDPGLVVSATVFTYINGVRCEFDGNSFMDIEFDIDRNEWVVLGFHKDVYGEYDQYRNFGAH